MRVLLGRGMKMRGNSIFVPWFHFINPLRTSFLSHCITTSSECWLGIVLKTLDMSVGEWPLSQ
jgi:hypothetical protein